MSCDLPCMSYMALYIVSMHIIQSNSRTSTHHWRLNVEEGKVQAAVADSSLNTGLPGYGDVPDDPLLSILTNKVTSESGEWQLSADSSCKEDCKKKSNGIDFCRHIKLQVSASMRTKNETVRKLPYNFRKQKSEHLKLGTWAERKSALRTKKASETDNRGNPTSNKKEKKKHALDCGKAVNFTQFDHLRGISSRKNHPHIPEPEVAMIFKKKGSKHAEVDMAELEKKLKKSKKEKPKSAQVYNQIGNFWRIKGNTQLSIECFRKALALSPNHPDVLLNLARVLFNLQFLDDAIFLTRKSLEMQSPDQNSWLQHFTLGEILKAYGHYHEAALHFRHTLDLNPGFQPAQAHIREMEVNPDATVTYYTLFIILFLVLGVLCGILSSIDGNLEELGGTIKTQRHFNRAMAMRSIKLGINPKLIRMRKQYSNAI